ncbi:MAG TPA: MMPL family transporter [Actinomycetes bacterium]|jgi:RND superfamily putative drug exporter|nr:MMPL family transporter [Actinomycetes bacterium]
MRGARRIAALPCGRWSKWAVLVFWIAVFAVAGPLAGKLNSAQQNDASAWLPNNAESTQVVELAKRFVPSDVFPALVVYERPGGAVTAADRAKAAADVRRFAAVNDVSGEVVGPIPAKDGRALQVIVPIKVAEEGNGWEQLGPRIKELRAIARADADGLGVYVTGPAGYFADFASVFSGFDSTLLYITAAIVVVILLLTYRSPVLWMLPLACVFVALTAAQAVIYLLAKNGGLTVNGQSAFILTVLVFGAGTDYALLLTARYREELRRHADRHQAMAVALGRAGPAILASGSTVILSLLCLLVAELNSTKSLGPVMAIGVAVGLGAMLSLLPALLVIFGRWMFWPLRPTLGSAEPTERGLWARIGQRMARRPRVVWVVTAVVLGSLALGVTGLEANGLQSKDSFRSTPEAVRGEQVLARHFAAGEGSPVQVVGKAGAAGQLRSALAATPGVTAVTRPVVRDGLAYVEGTLSSSADSQASYDTVDRLRASVHAIAGADAKVGGGSAVNLDVLRASRHDRNLVVPLVLLVVLVILALVLRALVAPLLLVATVVLSFGAALGVSALAFDHLFGFAGADPALPLWAFVFLAALGTDYNIFLMTRVHEESGRHGTRRGALVGLAATGGVITSAGAVLAGTFAALGSLPLVFITEIGFAVAFGVLLDTFVVRSVLVTALNLDVGRWMWWPSRLHRKRDVDLGELEEETAALPPLTSAPTARDGQDPQGGTN